MKKWPWKRQPEDVEALTPLQCQTLVDHLEIVLEGLRQTKNIMLEDPNIDDIGDLLDAVADVDFQIATIEKVKGAFEHGASLEG